VALDLTSLMSLALYLYNGQVLRRSKSSCMIFKWSVLIIEKCPIASIDQIKISENRKINLPEGSELFQRTLKIGPILNILS
jgi:hypothetical protein